MTDKLQEANLESYTDLELIKLVAEELDTWAISNFRKSKMYAQTKPTDPDRLVAELLHRFKRNSEAIVLDKSSMVWMDNFRRYAKKSCTTALSDGINLALDNFCKDLGEFHNWIDLDQIPPPREIGSGDSIYVEVTDGEKRWFDTFNYCRGKWNKSAGNATHWRIKAQE